MIRALLATALLAVAHPPSASAQSYDAVLTSPHNFFARSEFPIGSRVCYGCHADGPDRGGVSASPAPADGAPAPIDTSAPPVDAPPPAWQRGAKAYTVSHTAGGSTACLGCHDGVLGQEVHQMGRPDAPSFDHPYDVVYPRRANGRFVPERPTVNQYRYWSLPDLRDGDLLLPTGPTSRFLTVPANATGPDAAGARVVRTREGRVQCDSCHDPHDNGSAPFLRAPARDLCLICHDR